MSESSTRTILRPRSAPAAVRVVVVAGPSTGAAAVGKKITLGRSRVADVPIADFTVSEFHVEIAAHEDGIEIRDLDSWNGTYFEGAPVLRVVVPRGATLTLGESAIRVDVASDQQPASPVRDSFRALLGR